MSNPSTPLPPPAPASPPRAAAPAQSTRKPLQFSMRTMLIVVTLVAFMAALLSYVGVDTLLLLGILVASSFIGPVCLGTLALYCRGYRQTFFLGAFAGSLSSFYLSNTLLQFRADWLALLANTAVAVATTIACGWVAVITRRHLERRGWHLPSNRDDSTPGA